jgi:hypothetical protein
MLQQAQDSIDVEQVILREDYSQIFSKYNLNTCRGIQEFENELDIINGELSLLRLPTPNDTGSDNLFYANNVDDLEKVVNLANRLKLYLSVRDPELLEKCEQIVDNYKALYEEQNYALQSIIDVNNIKLELANQKHEIENTKYIDINLKRLKEEIDYIVGEMSLAKLPTLTNYDCNDSMYTKDNGYLEGLANLAIELIPYIPEQDFELLEKCKNVLDEHIRIHEEQNQDLESVIDANNEKLDKLEFYVPQDFILDQTLKN